MAMLEVLGEGEGDNKNKMKIIQIGSYPLDVSCIKGGVEASVYGLAQKLGEQHQVSVFDVPRVGINDFLEISGNVIVRRFTNKGKNNIFALLRIFSIIKKIKQEKPDICHIHGSNLFSFFLWLFLKISKIKVIVTIHGLIHVEQHNSWQKKRSVTNFIKLFYQSISEFLLLSLCKEIIVDTAYVELKIREYKKQRKIFRTPHCHIIPQGISDVFFELENNAKHNHVLSVGAIGRRKGHLLLIEALAVVKKEIHNVKLTIAGSLHDKNYYVKIKEKIKEFNLEDNIQIKENIPLEKLLELYKENTIFALHSEEESQGIVFCEAMAVGLSIVATNVGGISYVVENEKNGLLSSFGNIEDFACNIISLLKDDVLRNKMKEINKTEAIKYAWKNISDKILSLYIV